MSVIYSSENIKSTSTKSTYNNAFCFSFSHSNLNYGKHDCYHTSDRVLYFQASTYDRHCLHKSKWASLLLSKDTFLSRTHMHTHEEQGGLAHSRWKVVKLDFQLGNLISAERSDHPDLHIIEV